MSAEQLTIYREPEFKQPRLVLGFSGWMDGGDVSTGTVKYLRDALKAEAFAHIEPEGFYIYNFPGSMEISALFRPHTRIKDGVILDYETPKNTFYCAEQANVILFVGKEPNLAWQQYASCIFSLCKKFGVKSVYFIGSVAGLAPHTREPRIMCSFSDERLGKLTSELGLKSSTYEGPAGIITYLTHRAPQEGISMVNLVAEIPAYVQGYNPRCIETMIRCLGRLLDLKLRVDDLREVGEAFEKKLSEVVAGQPELAEKISQLEQDYDNQVFDTEMGDLKDWLEEKGIRLD